MIATPQGTAGEKKDGGRGRRRGGGGENEIGMNGKVWREGRGEGGQSWKMRKRLEKEEKRG